MIVEVAKITKQDYINALVMHVSKMALINGSIYIPKDDDLVRFEVSTGDSIMNETFAFTYTYSELINEITRTWQVTS